MKVNEDLELAAARRRAAAAERKLARAIAALEQGPSLRQGDRERLLAELRDERRPA